MDMWSAYCANFDQLFVATYKPPVCHIILGRHFGSTVGPRLSGHQLSGYLYYPAMILQYIVYCLYCLFSTTVLLNTKTK